MKCGYKSCKYLVMWDITSGGKIELDSVPNPCHRSESHYQAMRLEEQKFGGMIRP